MRTALRDRLRRTHVIVASLAAIGADVAAIAIVASIRDELGRHVALPEDAPRIARRCSSYARR